MSAQFGHPSGDCTHIDDAGPYVLCALPDEDRLEFVAHLETCAICRDEVEQLQIVADQLPMAAPQMQPPPDLRSRIMAVVESEAELLRAAGSQADRAPAVRPAKLRDRVWWPSWSVSPGFAAALASCVLLVGLGAGVLLKGEDGPGPTRTLEAQTAPAGAKASVTVHDGRATLVVRGMPAAPSGRVYQVWLKRASGLEPTHTLFSVRSDGRAQVEVDERLDDAQELLVTAEPGGGSTVPTSAPVLTATLT
jgi:anti-sigma-K factor RskA